MKRWAGVDRQICEYSRPYKNIVHPRRCHPNATGFVKKLYEIHGLPRSLAQQVETAFFQPVDTWASDALQKLESGCSESEWTDHERSAWTRFILSLLLRCPEDVELLREAWPSRFHSTSLEQEQEYADAKTARDPPTFAEWLRRRPKAEQETQMFRVFRELVDHDRIGEKINNMIWRVVEFYGDIPSLLTSDHPVIRTESLAHRDGHLALPIGPRKLFVAAHESGFLATLESSDRVLLAKRCNKYVVEAAVRFVYGIDDRQLRFVQNRIGIKPQRRLIETLLSEKAYDGFVT